jgi:uncharacterized integral membrane protein
MPPTGDPPGVDDRHERTSHREHRHTNRLVALAAAPTTVSGPVTNQAVSQNCKVALKEASRMLDRAAQALKDWRLHAKALTDYREGKISLAEARRRWDVTTKVAWLAPTGSTSKPRSTRRPPRPVTEASAAWRSAWHHPATSSQESLARSNRCLTGLDRRVPMAAFFLFILAAAGGVVVGNLVWENTAAAEVTVFGQPVSGYPQGWLLGAAAGLGFLIAMLLVTSMNVTKRRRERRRQLRRLRRRRHRQLMEPDQERPSVLDHWFGHDDSRT